MFKPITLLLFLLLVPVLKIAAQVDADTLLSLRFNNSLTGERGETPVSATGQSFSMGVREQGLSQTDTANLEYAAANNINSLEGTVEFWIKPNWNGNDGRQYTFLDWGGGGSHGMIIYKHGGNKLSISADRFTQWKELEVDVADWRAGDWHYVAVTYSDTAKRLQIFTDGMLKGEKTFTGSLPPISWPRIHIGTYGSTEPFRGVLDDFRISNRVRTPAEITSRYFSVFSELTVTNIDLTCITRTLWPTWKIPFTVTAETNLGRMILPPVGISLESSDPERAFLGMDGLIHAVAPGSVNLTVRVPQVQTTVPFVIRPPMRPPSVTTPTGFRSLPATGGLYKMPVVSLRYVPTADGVNVDLTWAPWFGTSPISIAELERNMDSYDEIRKFGLEEGSRFRDYGTGTRPPSLNYQIIANITVYEPPPPGEIIGVNQNLPQYSTEMFQVFDRLNMQEYIENRGAKEIWYWGPQLDPGYPGYNPAIHPPENFRGYPETNMASPTTSDISNSNRNNSDLPIYSHTYIVFGIHNRRFDNLTLHIDGHQQESILQYINNFQDNNTDLFSKKFAGYTTSGQIPQGRAGDTHHPPNATIGYDYNNFTPVESDIRDWRPDGTGQKIMYSAATVRDTPYVFPNNFLGSNRNEPHWYIFWRQSFPGYGNTIPYQVGPASYRMTNWWQFTGDWDRAVRSGVGLYEPASCTYTLSSTSGSFPAAGGGGSLTVTSSSGCKWFASNNDNWANLTSGDIGNGSGTVNFTVQPNTSGTVRTTSIAIAGQPFLVTQQAGIATVTVGGRVTTPFGFGLRNATVSIIDSLGVRRSATTSSFGFYSFDNVRAGDSYVVSVSSRLYRFASQTLLINTNLTNVDFVGLE